MLIAKEAKIMKKIAQFLLITAGFAFSGVTIAETITPGFNPDTTACDFEGADQTCWTDSNTAQPSLDDLLKLVFGADNYTLSDWDTLYKKEVDGGAESGSFAGSYSTGFFNSETDPSNATITFGGGTAITCPVCYLWVKDGNQDPSLYVFDIGWWDGTSTFSLSGFWTGQGAISNIGIFGMEGMQVPEPGTLGLLGLGLIGLGIARRRRTAA